MKLRIKFRKYGVMKFIGHLDMMRYFQKVMRRADIDIAYSGGFSPHQIMSFASPLGVGLMSNGEYLDIEVRSWTSSDQMLFYMNQVMAEGVEILAVRKLPDDAKNAMSSVAFADYTVQFREGYEPSFSLSEILPEFLSQPQILIEKQTKKSSRQVDLKPLIQKLLLTKDGGVFMRVSAGSMENIKPELVMDAVYHFAGEERGEFALEITREDLYDENGQSLIDVGEEF